MPKISFEIENKNKNKNKPTTKEYHEIWEQGRNAFFTSSVVW